MSEPVIDPEWLDRLNIADDPTTHLIYNELLTVSAEHPVLEAVDNLPPELRVVVELRIWGRWSYPRIGAEVGIKDTSAARRFNRALELLRETLQAAN